jgi:hypothetical protein
MRDTRIVLDDSSLDARAKMAMQDSLWNGLLLR